MRGSKSGPHKEFWSRSVTALPLGCSVDVVRSWDSIQQELWLPLIKKRITRESRLSVSVGNCLRQKLELGIAHCAFVVRGSLVA